MLVASTVKHTRLFAAASFSAFSLSSFSPIFSYLRLECRASTRGKIPVSTTSAKPHFILWAVGSAVAPQSGKAQRKVALIQILTIRTVITAMPES